MKRARVCGPVSSKSRMAALHENLMISNGFQRIPIDNVDTVCTECMNSNGFIEVFGKPSEIGRSARVKPCSTALRRVGPSKNTRESNGFR